MCNPGPWLPVPSACWLIPSRNHGPWAARIELRISAFFFFLNNTVSHNILHVKLVAWSLLLGACGSDWSMHALTSLIEACCLRPGPGARRPAAVAAFLELMT